MCGDGLALNHTSLSAGPIYKGGFGQPHYRDYSNRLLGCRVVQPTLMVYTMAYTDG